MACPVRCNVCFQQPGKQTTHFHITNCGHVLCEVCLQKGKKEVCGVCKSQCRTMLLSDEADPNVKMLFMDVNELCRKYLKDLTQIAKLEEASKELTKKLESNIRYSQSSSRMPPSGSLTNSSVGSYRGISPMSQQANTRQHGSCESIEPMDTSTTVHNKKDPITGPNRLLFISPPKDGHMGYAPYKNSSMGSLSLRSSVPSSQSNIQQLLSQADRGEPSSRRSPYLFSQTSGSSQSSAVRKPITLANILQRRS
ncbi:probable E3 SUMO-protein ligase RNF212 isoform X2 [Hyperolius riggenbachi]|uniref:probable E3 SUMO-protein ligase RNF212 isoform X2 n=1 Tax=Hyperolius riggenbachi TaxID=752182 RepID=UPI0035A30875